MIHGTIGDGSLGPRTMGGPSGTVLLVHGSRTKRTVPDGPIVITSFLCIVYK